MSEPMNDRDFDDALAEFPGFASHPKDCTCTDCEGMTAWMRQQVEEEIATWGKGEVE